MMKQLSVLWHFLDENVSLVITGMLAASTVPISQFIEDSRPLISQIVLVCGLFIAIFGVMLSARKWWRGSIINPKRKKNEKQDNER